MIARKSLYLTVCTSMLVAAFYAHAAGDASLLGPVAAGPAGWSDRQGVVEFEGQVGDEERGKKRVRVQERLSPELEISSLVHLNHKKLGPLRLLDIWSADGPQRSWVWRPGAEGFASRPRPIDMDEKADYRYLQLLDLLPRLYEEIEAENVGTEKVGEIEAVVLDIDVGVRKWPHGRWFRVWLDQDRARLQKVEDRSSSGAVKRRITVLEYADVEGRATPVKVLVEDIEGGRRTTLVRHETRYDRGIAPETFDPARTP